MRMREDAQSHVALAMEYEKFVGGGRACRYGVVVVVHLSPCIARHYGSMGIFSTGVPDVLPAA